jgi:hypothetical protein
MGEYRGRVGQPRPCPAQAGGENGCIGDGICYDQSSNRPPWHKARENLSAESMFRLRLPSLPRMGLLTVSCGREVVTAHGNQASLRLSGRDLSKERLTAPKAKV